MQVVQHGARRTARKQSKCKNSNTCENGTFDKTVRSTKLYVRQNVQNNKTYKRQNCTSDKTTEKKPPKAAINLGTDVDAPWGEKIETSRKENRRR